MLFFKEVPPPLTSENIRNRFEEELYHCNVKCFRVVTDNAANMKCAFLMNDDDDETAGREEESSDEESDEDDFQYWTPQPRKF